MTRLIRLLLFLLVMADPASAESFRVGAAISLRDALGEIAERYQASSGDSIEFVFASSGQIAAQITSGASIDLFISAANKQVDALIDANLADRTTRRVIAANRIVLIVPVDAANPPGSIAALAGDSVQRLAIGEPRTVPAGEYAAQVLASLKLTDAVADKLVYGKNVRQVLSYVERGEVSAGIVYATDARQSGDKVRVVDRADDGMHDPVVYPSVVVSASRHSDAARKFQIYLAESPQARAVLTKKGFAVSDSAEPKAADK